MFKTKREARLSDFEHPMRSVCTTLLREVRLRFGMTIKKTRFFFVMRSPCTTLLREVRRHLSSTNKKNAFFLCTAFGLH